MFNVHEDFYRQLCKCNYMITFDFERVASIPRESYYMHNALSVIHYICMIFFLIVLYDAAVRKTCFELHYF